jgi:molybdate transport system substrate-binding protein
MTRVLTSTLLAILVALGSQAIPAAQTTTLHIIASNGIKTVLEKVVPEYERAAKVKLDIEWGASAVHKRTIEGGKAFDATIVTPVVIDDLIKQGLVVAGSKADIAKSDLAIGMHTGGTKGDVSTPDALKARLLAAKTVVYAREGAATGTFNQMMATLGITEAMKAKIVLQPPGSVTPAQTVGSGQNELVFAPVSELVAEKGVEVLGRFPQAFQSPVVMTGGVSAKATHADAARAFVAFMAGPKVDPVLAPSGMERVAAGHEGHH